MGLKFSSSPTFSFFRFLSLHYLGLFFTLLLFLLCVIQVSSLCCSCLLFALLYSPFLAALLSSLCYFFLFTLLSSPFHVAFFSSSCCWVLVVTLFCSPQFFFAFLLSFSHCFPFRLLSSSTPLIFQVQVLCATIVLFVL